MDSQNNYKPPPRSLSSKILRFIVEHLNGDFKKPIRPNISYPFLDDQAGQEQPKHDAPDAAFWRTVNETNQRNDPKRKDSQRKYNNSFSTNRKGTAKVPFPQQPEKAKLSFTQRIRRDWQEAVDTIAEVGLETFDSAPRRRHREHRYDRDRPLRPRHRRRHTDRDRSRDRDRQREQSPPYRHARASSFRERSFQTKPIISNPTNLVDLSQDDQFPGRIHPRNPSLDITEPVYMVRRHSVHIQPPFPHGVASERASILTNHTHWNDFIPGGGSARRASVGFPSTARNPSSGRHPLRDPANASTQISSQRRRSTARPSPLQTFAPQRRTRELARCDACQGGNQVTTYPEIHRNLCAICANQAFHPERAASAANPQSHLHPAFRSLCPPSPPEKDFADFDFHPAPSSFYGGEASPPVSRTSSMRSLPNFFTVTTPSDSAPAPEVPRQKSQPQPLESPFLRHPRTRFPTPPLTRDTNPYASTAAANPFSTPTPVPFNSSHAQAQNPFSTAPTGPRNSSAPPPQRRNATRHRKPLPSSPLRNDNGNGNGTGSPNPRPPSPLIPASESDYFSASSSNSSTTMHDTSASSDSQTLAPGSTCAASSRRHRPFAHVDDDQDEDGGSRPPPRPLQRATTSQHQQRKRPPRAAAAGLTVHTGAPPPVPPVPPLPAGSPAPRDRRSSFYGFYEEVLGSAGGGKGEKGSGAWKGKGRRVL